MTYPLSISADPLEAAEFFAQRFWGWCVSRGFAAVLLSQHALGLMAFNRRDLETGQDYVVVVDFLECRVQFEEVTHQGRNPKVPLDFFSLAVPEQDFLQYVGKMVLSEGLTVSDIQSKGS